MYARSCTFALTTFLISLQGLPAQDATPRAPSLATPAPIPAVELRAVWLSPRVKTSADFMGPDQIEEAMRQLAEARCNVVYFNVWSRGWPLWRSEVFLRASGHWSDPALKNRDLLAEAQLAAHRHGLEVVPWFESGFVGWSSQNHPLPNMPAGPLLSRNPEFEAVDQDGKPGMTEVSSEQVHWLAAGHKGVRQLLLDLCVEVARRYDIDGILLDRIHYPDIRLGYDKATLEQWRTAAGAAADAPSPAPDDPAFVDVRVEGLSRFQADVRAALRAIDPELRVHNTTQHDRDDDTYLARQDHLQDWVTWLERQHVDAMTAHLPVPATQLVRVFRAASALIDEKSREHLFAGIRVKQGTTSLTPAELAGTIDDLRKAGARGHGLWQYHDLVAGNHLAALAKGPYARASVVPGRKPGYRMPPLEIDPTSREGNIVSFRMIAPMAGKWDIYTESKGARAYMTTEMFGEGEEREFTAIDVERLVLILRRR